MSHERLDQLIDTLASTQPRLDDVTRARVAANLAEAVRVPVSRLVRYPRWCVPLVATAIAIAIGFAWRGGEPTAGAWIRPAPLTEVREGELLSAGHGATVRGEIAGAYFILNGPGWAKRIDGRLYADAAVLVIDRVPRAIEEAPLELEMFAASIRLQNATFSIDSGKSFRVSVMRGEIWLRCANANQEDSLVAGASASCGLGADVRAPAIGEVAIAGAPLVAQSSPAVAESPAAFPGAPASQAPAPSRATGAGSMTSAGSSAPSTAASVPVAAVPPSPGAPPAPPVEALPAAVPSAAPPPTAGASPGALPPAPAGAPATAAPSSPSPGAGSSPAELGAPLVAGAPTVPPSRPPSPSVPPLPIASPTATDAPRSLGLAASPYSEARPLTARAARLQSRRSPRPTSPRATRRPSA